MGWKPLVMALLALALVAPLVGATSQVILSYRDNTYTLTDEQGAKFATNFTITFLDSGLGRISSVQVSDSTSSLSVPSNTAYMVLRANNIERYVYLPGLANNTLLAFPASPDVMTLKTAKVSIYDKPSYDVLTVKTVDNRVVARFRLSDFTDIFFTGLVGKIYIFQLERGGEVVYSQNVAMTSSLDYVAIIPPTSQGIHVNLTRTLVQINASYSSEYRRIRGFITSSSPISGLAWVRIYSANKSAALLASALVANFTNVNSTDFTYFVPDTVHEPFRAVIIVNTTAGTFTKTLLCGANHRYISEELLPNGFMIIILMGLGLFAPTRKHVDIAGFLAALLITLGGILGIVDFPSTYYPLVYALAVSMFVFSRERREAG